MNPSDCITMEPSEKGGEPDNEVQAALLESLRIGSVAFAWSRTIHRCSRRFSFRVLVGLITLSAVISSCCTRMDCNGFEDESEVRFVGFEPHALDTVAMEVFSSGFDPASRLDSVTWAVENGLAPSDEFTFFLRQDIEVGYALRFTLKGSGNGETFELNGFSVKREPCNTCFPYHPASDYVTRLESYLVNGVRFYNGALKVHR